MRYFALASDYDGTIAHHGTVSPSTLEALKRFRDTGRQLLLVTGREIEDLKAVFPEYKVFHWIVGENGPVLLETETDSWTLLSDPPPSQFAQELRHKGVSPLYVGHVIVATLDDQKEQVLDTIHQLGLELQMIFNKGSLMVLPSGINKATGLKACLKRIGLSVHNAVGVGDAENDHAFLSVCERSAAVANALPALKERSDLVTTGSVGEGVAELIGQILEDDLASIPARHRSESILLGNADNKEVSIPVYGTNFLVAGTSGGGKSTLSTGFLERLVHAEYQFCAIDPEGDYQNFEGALVMGDSKKEPKVEEILQVLEKPESSVIVNLLGVDLDQRPTYFASLFSRLRDLRARTGRPHWIFLDEAHHLLPSSRETRHDVPVNELTNTMLVTLEPDHLPQDVLAGIDTLIAVGKQPQKTIETFCHACDEQCPRVESEGLAKGEAIFWSRPSKEAPIKFNVAPCETEHVRHSRKYASADLTPDRSFYFRGPEGKLNLRAQNLMTFVQLLQGIDDETWLHHLRQGEYSQWFRENIKSDELADAAASIEEDQSLSAEESRAKIKEQIEERYTLPA
ncbi:MAG: HAD family phosphatase [Acidobacteriaceae bacterium]|nr:HAD family phosphatase [Acidobacteriaceae bacterium]